MEVKPGYKQTEVGVIPKEWEVSQVGQATTKVGSGITPTGGNRVYKSEGRPFLRSQNIGWGTLLLDDVAFIDDAIHFTFADTEINNGDVFLNITGASIGRSSVADSRVEGGNVNQHVCIVRPDYERLTSQFLNCLLLSSLGQSQIDSFQAGGNRQGLNFAQVRSIRLPVPPIPEQLAIGMALSDVDGLLGGLDRLIAKKRDLKQAAMQQLLTGQTRLPGFHGEWEVKPLGELIFRLKKTTRPSSSGRAEGAYPFFTNTTKPVDKFLDEADFDTEAIIANTGGEAYFNYYNGNFAAMADCFVFKASLVTLFLYYFLKLVERAVNDNGFTGSGIKHLDKKFFYQMEVRCPAELPEQTAIATVLSEMDGELAVLEQRREKTRALKQAMMQELLTGKIRLL